MIQNVIFRVVENEKEIEEIEAKIQFEKDGSFDINFFDRQTGYSSKSSAFGSQQNWSFQDPESQKNLFSLMYAVDAWDDWTDSLSWVDNGEDVFLFRFTGESIYTEEGYMVKNMERVF